MTRLVLVEDHDMVAEAIGQALERAGIERLGLRDSLAAYLADTSMVGEARYGLELEPGDDAAVTILRIYQEALTNVRKHARALFIVLELSTVDHGFLVRVLIADDDPLIRDVPRDVLDDEPDLEVDAGAVDEMRRASVTDYLAKGVRNTELVAAVRRWGGR